MYTLENAKRFITEYLKNPWILGSREKALIENWINTLVAKIESYESLRLKCSSAYQYNAYSIGLNQYRAILNDLNEILKADSLASRFSSVKDENYHTLISEALA